MNDTQYSSYLRDCKQSERPADFLMFHVSIKKHLAGLPTSLCHVAIPPFFSVDLHLHVFCILFDNVLVIIMVKKSHANCSLIHVPFAWNEQFNPCSSFDLVSELESERQSYPHNLVDSIPGGGGGADSSQRFVFLLRNSYSLALLPTTNNELHIRRMKAFSSGLIG